MSGRQSLKLPSHDVLSKMARDDPEAYEAFRREVIENFIDGAPPEDKRRLRGLQFRVDSERRRLLGSALGSTVKIYQLMWESFLTMNNSWQDILRVDDEDTKTHAPMSARKEVSNEGASIIEFRPRSSLPR